MKTYVKPELFFESFELAQHIAGCNLTLVTDQDVRNCAASGTIYDITLDGEQESWFLNRDICTAQVEAYCYTNGSMNIATINS